MTPTDRPPGPVPLLVTGNPSKLEEARRMFPALESRDLDLPEIQSLELMEVLRHKARAAYETVGAPVIVDETGLELDAFGGFPGPLVKWMLDTVGHEGMARLAASEGDTRATAICGLFFTDGDHEVYAQGASSGHLVLPPRGPNGFGWDPVFQPEGSELTYGEMTPAEKDAISHRGRAWRAFARALAAEGIDI